MQLRFQVKMGETTMTLAQVQAVVAVVVALGATWAGLMMAVALTLPVQTRRAESALETAPRRCLFSGVGLFLLFMVAVKLLQAPLPLAKLLGFALVMGLCAVLTLGAAGIAQLMGKRIGEMAGARTSFGMLVRGSVVFSMAMLFPWIGWFLFAPLAGLCALGAGASALWPRRRMAMPPVPPNIALESQGVA
jgi:hypothetical protein